VSGIDRLTEEGNMDLANLVSNPAFSRALVVGAFGGVGLALTMLYSRRGPLIFAPYAALLAALTVLLARYAALPYAARLAAALAGFLVASAILYVTAAVLAERARRRLIAENRLPASALRVPLSGHAWRAGLLLIVGTVLSAGVAFLAG
jgi:hypothetical protein